MLKDVFEKNNNIKNKKKSSQFVKHVVQIMRFR